MTCIDYRFISSKHINKINLDKVSLMNVVEKYYTSHSSTLYVISEDNPDCLVGIIALGDVIRYRKSEKDIINRNYSVISKLDDETIRNIYEEKRTICQIPVVSDDNKLMGAVIFPEREKSNLISEGFDKVLKSFYYQKQLENISHVLDRVGVDIKYFIYPEMDSVVFGKDRDCLIKKQKEYHSSQIAKMTDEDQAKFFNDEYYCGIGNDFQEDYNKISVFSENGIVKYKDLDSRFFNIKNGKRIQPNCPKKAKQRLFVVGACFILGAYVSDTRTIPYYLQDRINHELDGSYEVINCGNMGDASISPLFCEHISANDMVILVAAHLELILAILNAKTTRPDKVFMLSPAFEKENFSVDYLFNSITHHNSIINRYMSDYIYDNIANDLKRDKCFVANCYEPQNYYINADVFLCFQKLRFEYDVKNKYIGKRNGAIVMNCNPFTNGHRYLVEKAIQNVDHLYVFVVEEDLSLLKFKDRLEMVKRGLADLIDEDLVTVIPSGKFIISKETFSQYFEKEDAVEVIHSMEYDLRIFAEVVCDVMEVNVRFVGQEPTDPVTNEYNSVMKRLLPEYGIEVMEFERMTGADGNAVSATKVRKWLKSKEWEKIRLAVPQSSYNYLRAIWHDNI